MIAAVAVASWLGTLFFSMRLVGAGMGPKTAVAGGWILLIAALASAFMAQARVAHALDRVDAGMATSEAVAGGASGTIAQWLVVAGLAAIGVAALIA